MSRLQTLTFYASILALMVLNIAIELLGNPPDQLAWVPPVNIGLCLLVGAGALILLLRTWTMPGDGLPFSNVEREARKRARRFLIIFVPLGTLAVILLLNLVRRSSVDSSTQNGVIHASNLVYPLLGLIALVGMRRSGAHRGSNEADTPRL